MNNKLKKAWFLPMLIMTLMSCLVLTSCGDDDKDDPSSASIVGSWRTEFSGGYYQVTFEKNGKYSEVNYEPVYGADTDYGTYTVSGDRLTMVDSEGDKYYYTILTLTSDKLVLMDEDGDSDIFARVK